jgi:hypothetical protein
VAVAQLIIILETGACNKLSIKIMKRMSILTLNLAMSILPTSIETL